MTCRRFKTAVQGEEESRADLDQYTANSNPDELKEWQEIAKQCQQDRLTNPQAMDVYDLDPGQAAITKNTHQLNLIEVEGGTGTGKGEASWLAHGLKLEEAQYAPLEL